MSLFRRARRITALLAPGEQQPEGIGDVPGRFGVHGDDAGLDPALTGNVVRRVRGRKRVRKAHGFGGHEAEPDLGRGTARIVSHGPRRAPRTRPVLSAAYDVPSILPTPLLPRAATVPVVGGVPWRYRGHRVLRPPRRVVLGERRTPYLPERSARRRVGIVSAAIEATSRKFSVCAVLCACRAEA